MYIKRTKKQLENSRKLHWIGADNWLFSYLFEGHCAFINQNLDSELHNCAQNAPIPCNFDSKNHSTNLNHSLLASFWSFQQSKRKQQQHFTPVLNSESNLQLDEKFLKTDFNRELGKLTHRIHVQKLAFRVQPPLIGMFRYSNYFSIEKTVLNFQDSPAPS